MILSQYLNLKCLLSNKYNPKSVHLNILVSSSLIRIVETLVKINCYDKFHFLKIKISDRLISALDLSLAFYKLNIHTYTLSIVFGT